MEVEQHRRDAAADVVEIAQLVLGERESISRQWWRQAADCYEEGAQVQLLDFYGSALDYLDFRRRESARGIRVRWRLFSPVVHVNVERAVAIVDGILTVGLAEAEERVELDATLLVRVRRRHLPWRVVGIDAFVARGTLTAPPDTNGVGPQSHVEGSLFAQATRLVGEQTATREIASSERHLTLLAWAGLTPGV